MMVIRADFAIVAYVLGFFHLFTSRPPRQYLVHYRLMCAFLCHSFGLFVLRCVFQGANIYEFFSVPGNLEFTPYDYGVFLFLWREYNLFAVCLFIDTLSGVDSQSATHSYLKYSAEDFQAPHRQTATEETKLVK